MIAIIPPCWPLNDLLRFPNFHSRPSRAEPPQTPQVLNAAPTPSPSLLSHLTQSPNFPLSLSFFQFKWTIPPPFNPFSPNVHPSTTTPTAITSVAFTTSSPYHQDLSRRETRQRRPRLRHRHRFRLPGPPLHRPPRLLHLLSLRRCSPSPPF